MSQKVRPFTSQRLHAGPAGGAEPAQAGLRQQLTARRSRVELLIHPDTSIDDLTVEPVHTDPVAKEIPKARVHRETGQTPADRWAAGDWLPRLPESLEELDLLLLTETAPQSAARWHPLPRVAVSLHHLGRIHRRAGHHSQWTHPEPAGQLKTARPLLHWLASRSIGEPKIIDGAFGAKGSHKSRLRRQVNIASKSLDSPTSTR